MGKDQLTSGLPDDFDGRIVQSTFLHDPKYNNGQTLLASITIQRLDNGEEVEQRYAFAQGWTDIGGQTAVHEAGAKNVNKSTAYGQFCEKALALVPDDVDAGIDLLSAKSWVGLTFHWDRVEEVKRWKDRVTGEEREVATNRIFPTNYIPDAEASATVTEMDMLVGAGYAVAVPAPLASSVKDLASQFPYAEWTKKVFAIEGALDHSDLVTACANEAFYSAIRG